MKKIRAPAACDTSTDSALVWQALKTFELAVETVLREVLRAKPEHYKPGFTPAEVVSAKLGMSADEFEQAMAKSLAQSGYQKASFMSCEPEPQGDSDNTPIQQGGLNETPEVGKTSWSRNEWERDLKKELDEIESYRGPLMEKYLEGLGKSVNEITPQDLQKAAEKYAAFKRAALWMRWFNYLMGYALREFAPDPERDLTQSTHSDQGVREMQEAEENQRRKNYETLKRLAKQNYKNLGYTYVGLINLFETAEDLDNLTKQLTEATGQIMGMKDVRRPRQGDPELYYTMRESLWRFAFEYLYNYAPMARTGEDVARGFKDVVDKTGYDFNYEIENERINRSNIGMEKVSKTVQIGQEWGDIMSKDKGGRPVLLKWGEGRGGGTLGQLFAEMGEFIAHEEIEAYFIEVLGEEAGMWDIYKGRSHAHFMTQAYLLHVAHSGLWKAMMEGRMPDQRTLNLTIDEFQQIYNRVRWAETVNEPHTDPAARLEEYPNLLPDESIEVRDMNAYIQARREELGWGSVEEWYPYKIWEKEPEERGKRPGE
ncbi:hypothetical protein JXM67_15105 [candidate division WOR-3 bacterium]|nr:hypothetical protein [candidate division WOR-3 bacterium]